MKKETLEDRENQLNLLHQEILMRREGLLHTSGNSLRQSTHSLASTGTVGPADASIRNARLLKDVELLNQTLQEELNMAPSPRFVTLQNNYWSMVRGLLPLWEQSLPGQRSSQHQQQPQKAAGKSVRHARSTK
ncbi:hypothetical protein V1264_007533 [Littorina saxatilis]